ncbi:MAG: hypothetical protein HUJ63_13415 [Enterococcus sp.]|nr:hypothetical protein [Enterococcus sp.]
MERYLDDIVELLKKKPPKLAKEVTKSKDGRLDSAVNEDAVIKRLSQNRTIGKLLTVPKMRSFYDFSLKQDGNELYVNIKISDLNNNSADNCSSKEGLGYALTGLTKMPCNYSAFHEKLLDNIKPGYDYYFLIVNKNNPRDVYWTSLKRIKTLVPNGNNLPFQCNWAENREFARRTEAEATQYLLETYLDSWDRKVKYYPSKLKEKIETSVIEF